MDEDLEKIEETFLQQCGACDLGLVEFGCTCPGEDYRPVMSALVQEVRELRAEVQRVVQRALDAQPQTGARMDAFLVDPSTAARRERPAHRKEGA